MDLIEKNSQIAIATTATFFALDLVLPEEHRYLEKLSYKHFLLLTTYLTAGLFLCDKGGRCGNRIDHLRLSVQHCRKAVRICAVLKWILAIFLSTR